MKMKLFTLFAVVMLWSCGQTQKPQDLEKVSIVLDWTINTNHTGLYVALENGYFKDQGLDVTVVNAPESGSVVLLAAGKADFAFSGQEEVFQTRTNEFSITAIAAVIAHNTSAFAARQSSGIKRPKDFEGKKYGGWGSPTEEAILKAVVKGDGGDGSKVQILNIGSMDFFGATDKLVDFAWIFQAWDGVQAQLKGVPLNTIELKDFDPGLDYYTPLIVTNTKTLKDRPSTVKKFLAGLSKGYEFAISNAEKAGDILLKTAPELSRDLVINSQKYLAGQYKADSPRWGEMNKERWLAFLNWLGDRKLIKESPDSLAGLFTNEFLP